MRLPTVILVLLSTALVIEQEATSQNPTVKVSVDLGPRPEAANVKLSFERTSSPTPVLLVTSLSLLHRDAPKRVERLKVMPIGDYVSHLTGWFVVQQRSQELWVGLSLRQGETHGEITLHIPEILHLVHDPDEYELTYSTSVTTLAELASGVGSVQYAEVKQVHIQLPKWAEMLEDKSSGWKKLRGNLFSADLDAKDAINVLTIRREPTPLADWLNSKLQWFGGGWIFGMALLVAFLSRNPTIMLKHRIGATVVVVVVVLILLAMSASWPPNWHIILFDGAHLFGFALAFFALAVFPGEWIQRLRAYFIDVRKG